MKELISILVLPCLTVLVGWLLLRWCGFDRARADQRAWQYLTWDDDTLHQHHRQYAEMLTKNEKRALCLRQINAIKAALEMKQKLRAEWERSRHAQ